MAALTDFLRFAAERRGEIGSLTVEHLWLTTQAVGIAILIGVPAGVALTRSEWLASPMLGVVNVVQTVPSLALLGFMIPLFGIGVLPAVVALVLYALLPIIRNTYTGIRGVDAAMTEAGRGMGMTDRQILFWVELPSAVPTIMAGLRTSTVINVGVATLCALIGAGGLGTLIFRGIAMVDGRMILCGAIPAALLAIVLDFLLGRAERVLTAVRAGQAT